MKRKKSHLSILIIGVRFMHTSLGRIIMNIHFYEKGFISKKTAKRLKSIITKPLCKIKEKVEEVHINIQFFDLQKPKLLKSLKVLITLKSGKEYYFVKNHSSLMEASTRMSNFIKNLPFRKDKENHEYINSTTLHI